MKSTKKKETSTSTECPKKSKSKKKEEVKEHNPLDDYIFPVLGAAEEMAFKAYCNIGFKKGVSSAKEGFNYRVILVKKDGTLCVTVSPVSFKNYEFISSEGIKINLQSIVAIKEI